VSNAKTTKLNGKRDAPRFLSKNARSDSSPDRSLESGDDGGDRVICENDKIERQDGRATFLAKKTRDRLAHPTEVSSRVTTGGSCQMGKRQNRSAKCTRHIFSQKKTRSRIAHPTEIRRRVMTGGSRQMRKRRS
jgi:hypothetical protein